MLRHLSPQIPKDDRADAIGATDSGKSTLLGIVLALHNLTKDAFY